MVTESWYHHEVKLLTHESTTTSTITKVLCGTARRLLWDSFLKEATILEFQVLLYTVPRKSLGTFGLFSHKMAFLKSKFKDDLVRVQRHTVRHFKDLE